MNRNPLRIFIPYEPVPQGSKVCSCLGGKPKMRESAKGHAGARKLVTKAAKDAMAETEWLRIERPIPAMVAVEFVYQMPVSRKSFWGTWRTVAPDSDKLFRLVGDSLKDAGVYDDDAQISAMMTIKHEVRMADIGRTAPEPGTYITVMNLRDGVEKWKEIHQWPI